MERNDVVKRFSKSSEIGTRTSGWDGLALLRIGEIASDTNNRPGTHVICFLNFMFKVSDCGHEELHLTLKSSKTDQRQKVNDFCRM
jgi:hypothetical protein